MSEIVKSSLFKDIKNLIEQSKRDVATQVNTALSIMYWSIGKKINDDILQNRRGDYGKEVLSTLSKQLQKEYGKGYSYSSLSRMMKFANIFKERNVATLSQHLSWSHGNNTLCR
ncbi:MAG: DUF1016 N-terminal domain-containing protein [Campylobacterota bacterium]|nr:DUF1016 N-terminal domain-containing protein [Campylobacterota bacterium]